MEDPKDSLNIEIFGFKVTAMGRFPVCVFFICFLVVAGFGAVLGPTAFQYFYPAQQVTGIK